MTKHFPPQLVLEYEIVHQQLQKVLLYHNTDRWYFGDFIRHSAWLSSLAALQPQSLELATSAAYLPLYQDGRVDRLINIAEFDTATLPDYDLVIIPSAYPPDAFDTTISRALYTWDRGWAYVRFGTVIQRGEKQQLNYFMAARHQTGQTALAASAVFPLVFADHETSATHTALEELFGNKNPIIVYNPTASNAFTRETDIKKEVDNSLQVSDHAKILARLRERLPAYNFLVGSAVKPGDGVNETAIAALTQAGDRAVTRSIYDLELAGATSIRGFAGILASPQVVGMIGAGTGTNTHLASLVGLASLSIERSADAAMIDNWQHPELFQMGSFRWRNPTPEVAIYVMDWDDKTSAEMARIADSFVSHLLYSQQKYGELFTVPIGDIRLIARHLHQASDNRNVPELIAGLSSLIGGMVPDAAAHYGNFDDEIKYLRLQDSAYDSVRDIDGLLSVAPAVLTHSADLLFQLYEHSNAYKLVQSLEPALPALPSPSSADEIFIKIRNGKPLSGAELGLLSVNDEHELVTRVAAEVAHEAQATLDRQTPQATVKGWQHTVSLYRDVVTKTFSANPLSEYLTDAYSRRGVLAALERGGGFVPQSYIFEDQVVSRRLTLVIDSDGRLPLFDGQLQGEVTFPYGWIREQLDRHIALIRHGVFNFDLKLSDVGITEQGVLSIVDFSVFRKYPQDIEAAEENRRTDIMRLALGELMQNGQLISGFANGPELLQNYTRDVERLFGVAILPDVKDWQWGDHEKQKYDQTILKLRQMIETISSAALPAAPVYALVDDVAAGIAYRYIQTQLDS